MLSSPMMVVSIVMSLCYHLKMVMHKASITLVAERVASRAIKSQSLQAAACEHVQALQPLRFEQGNFTVVTLQNSSGDILGLGVSKRMPSDVQNEIVGFNLALVRAVEMAVDEFIDSISQAFPMPKQMSQV